MKSETARLQSPTVAEEAREALRTLSRVPHRKEGAHIRAKPSGERGEVTVCLPREAYEVLLKVLEQMANGNAVTVLPVHTELTTHQAAEILNVSRPYLIGLLEAGKIPFRMVGTHRRIRLVDLMAYKKHDDARRDQAAAELSRQAEEFGMGY